MIGKLIGAAMIAAIAIIPISLGMRIFFPRLRDDLILTSAAAASMACGALVTLDPWPRTAHDPKAAIERLQAERAALIAESAAARLECQALALSIQDSTARSAASAACADAASSQSRVTQDITASIDRSIEAVRPPQALTVTPAPARSHPPTQ